MNAARIVELPGLGRVRVRAHAQGLLAVDLSGSFLTAKPAADAATQRHLDQAEAALLGYAQGARTMSEVTVDVSGLTAWQRAVVLAMLDIPFAGTCRYGELAQRVGKPGAARAVGNACGRNPIPIFFPCHRVLPASGGIGGFSGGPGWKARLLAHEQRYQSGAPAPLMR